MKRPDATPQDRAVQLDVELASYEPLAVQAATSGTPGAIEQCASGFAAVRELVLDLPQVMDVWAYVLISHADLLSRARRDKSDPSFIPTMKTRLAEHLDAIAALRARCARLRDEVGQS